MERGLITSCFQKTPVSRIKSAPSPIPSPPKHIFPAIIPPSPFTIKSIHKPSGKVGDEAISHQPTIPCIVSSWTSFP
jgi:hypothetical protein